MELGNTKQKRGKLLGKLLGHYVIYQEFMEVSAC